MKEVVTDVAPHLREIFIRPRPFDLSTVRRLWTDEHISKKMLEHHLDGASDISSRNAEFIDRSADWIIEHFELGRSRHGADFGCGPGLYTTRFARSGAGVTGIDFSARSLGYASRAAAREGLPIDYVECDYLVFESDTRFDLITMIMCDFCALGPQDRRKLLERFRRHLGTGGQILLDVYSLSALENRIEQCLHESDMLDEFFSPDPYDGYVTTFVYDEEKVVLDKYTIVQEGLVATFYNWFQHFSPDMLSEELAAAGFTVMEVLGDVAGAPFDPAAEEFAVIAGRQH